MRQYRGIRVDNGEWVYGGYYKWNNFDCIVQKDIWDLTTNKATLIKVDSETVGMETGLKDKNGTETYAKDIVRRADPLTTAVIVWNQRCCAFMWICVDKLGASADSGAYEFINTDTFSSNIGFEIIGNIHTHPNLLKETD